ILSDHAPMPHHPTRPYCRTYELAAGTRLVERASGGRGRARPRRGPAVARGVRGALRRPAGALTRAAVPVVAAGGGAAGPGAAHTRACPDEAGPGRPARRAAAAARPDRRTRRPEEPRMTTTQTAPQRLGSSPARSALTWLLAFGMARGLMRLGVRSGDLIA